MATYLVTGGCGFIGSHLADALLLAGHSVRILDDLSTGKLANKPRAAPLIEADVADARRVAEAMDGVDGCFHLAAQASVERSNRDWIGTHRTNLTGAITVFDAARRARRGRPVPVVYASSAAVYGSTGDGRTAETASTWPLSAYGADKLGCELHASVASHVHGVPTCGLRFFNVFGPRQDPSSPYSGVIAIFCERLKNRQPITIFGDGSQCRDFVYVGDAVSALLAAMAGLPHGSAVFNVCTGKATTIAALAELIGEVVGATPAIRFEPPRQGEIRVSIGDPVKARRDLGFSAQTDLRSGLANIVGSLLPA